MVGRGLGLCGNPDMPGSLGPWVVGPGPQEGLLGGPEPSMTPLAEPSMTPLAVLYKISLAVLYKTPSIGSL
jgi:hypothetical protein